MAKNLTYTKMTNKLQMSVIYTAQTKANIKANEFGHCRPEMN